MPWITLECIANTQDDRVVGSRMQASLVGQFRKGVAPASLPTATNTDCIFEVFIEQLACRTTQSDIQP
jgi:hypothetical protein